MQALHQPPPPVHKLLSGEAIRTHEITGAVASAEGLINCLSAAEGVPRLRVLYPFASVYYWRFACPESQGTW